MTNPGGSGSDSWMSFRNNWWGTDKLGSHWDMSEGKPVDDGVIRIDQDQVLIDFDSLLMPTLAIALTVPTVSIRACSSFGIILSGQPGIGEVSVSHFCHLRCEVLFRPKTT